jgi:hypothetical protein
LIPDAFSFIGSTFFLINLKNRKFSKENFTANLKVSFENIHALVGETRVLEIVFVQEFLGVLLNNMKII